VKNTASSVSGKELSRLASRVGDGEIGLFFTTSHYTRSAQIENHSTYPSTVRSDQSGRVVVQTELVKNSRLSDDIVSDIKTAV
jgi:hypothetical protein